VPFVQPITDNEVIRGAKAVISGAKYDKLGGERTVIANIIK